MNPTNEFLPDARGIAMRSGGEKPQSLSTDGVDFNQNKNTKTKRPDL